jgi:hypothetical protein
MFSETALCKREEIQQTFDRTNATLACLSAAETYPQDGCVSSHKAQTSGGTSGADFDEESALPTGSWCIPDGLIAKSLPVVALSVWPFEIQARLCCKPRSHSGISPPWRLVVGACMVDALCRTQMAFYSACVELGICNLTAQVASKGMSQW